MNLLLLLLLLLLYNIIITTIIIIIIIIMPLVKKLLRRNAMETQWKRNGNVGDDATLMRQRPLLEPISRPFLLSSRSFEFDTAN